MAAVEKAAFKLHPGEFSGIIPTRYGFHIVYIDRKKPRHTMTEAQAYDEIYAKLFNQKLATVYKDYMRYLRDKNFVEIVDAGGAAARAATAGTPDFSLSSP
jgi:parvulin-like peptidyl-prolyl isomerase